MKYTDKLSEIIVCAGFMSEVEIEKLNHTSVNSPTFARL